jgi:hypothetical protein
LTIILLMKVGQGQQNIYAEGVHESQPMVGGQSLPWDQKRIASLRRRCWPTRSDLVEYEP